MKPPLFIEQKSLPKPYFATSTLVAQRIKPFLSFPTPTILHASLPLGEDAHRIVQLVEGLPFLVSIAGMVGFENVSRDEWPVLCSVPKHYVASCPKI